MVQGTGELSVAWGGGEVEGQEARCNTCGGAELEDLAHFLLDCSVLERERWSSVELQRPRVEAREDIIGSFLFGGEDEERRKRVLLTMWRQRFSKRQELER